VWRFEAELAAGRMTQDEVVLAESGMARSCGHCMTMGTASTMACLAETLGLQLPGSAAWPAADSRRLLTAQTAGQRIVTLARERVRPSQILTRAAFENAIRVNAAIGGSTNAVIHLLAIAGRAGVPLRLDDFDELARPVPTLVNLMPSGEYLMEDFCYAGGVLAVMRELGDLLQGAHVGVSGRPLAEIAADAQCWNRDVIRSLADPLQPPGSGTAVLRGNLCPGGAVIKQSAASPRLLRHRGQALVFDSIEEYHLACDRDDLAADESTVLVVRGAGPKGYPGMPEVGNFVLPRILLERGVTDMVRISDARMSGTGYGTVVLHVAPEAVAGGPLAVLRTGDWITLDVPARSLRLEVSDDELAARLAVWQPPASPYPRGYARLYVDHVLQADQGADLDFLVGSSGAAVPRHNH